MSSQIVEQAGAIATRVVDGVASVLLVRAKKNPHDWIFPKGHIERGESAADAAVRELKEEAGYKGEVLGSVGSSTFMSGKEHVRVQYFHVLVAADARSNGSEPRERRWCSRDEALRLLSFADAKRLLEHVIPAGDRG